MNKYLEKIAEMGEEDYWRESSPEPGKPGWHRHPYGFSWKGTSSGGDLVLSKRFMDRVQDEAESSQKSDALKVGGAIGGTFGGLLPTLAKPRPAGKTLAKRMGFGAAVAGLLGAGSAYGLASAGNAQTREFYKRHPKEELIRAAQYTKAPYTNSNSLSISDE